MSEKISQEEIDALLGRAAAENTEAQPPESVQPNMELPNEMELDMLGEVFNISMGAAATAVSSLLRMKVDITTPEISLVDRDTLVCKSLEPALGVEIKYTKGIKGTNIFVLSQYDIMKIVDIMLGGTGDVDENTEFNEIHTSAISEVMNQMMGASSMALADMLNELIDISIPSTFVIEGECNFSDGNFEDLNGKVIVTRFKLVVGDIINSEMINTSSITFARDVVMKMMRGFDMTPSVEPPKTPTPEPAPAVYAAETPPPPAAQPSPPPQYAQNQQYHSPPPQQAAQRSPTPNVNIQPVNFTSFDGETMPVAYDSNMEMLMDIPLDVTVEIGRARRTVEEVLNLGEGSMIELDKHSSEPVDILVNNQLMARGTIWVAEENLVVRVTEIISNADKLKIARNKHVK